MAGVLTKAKLQSLLKRKLKLAKPTYKLEKYGGRLSGSVISPTFFRKDDHARQRMIWNALHDSLGSKAETSVGMILAYTPEEWDGPIRTSPRKPSRLAKTA